MALNKSQSYANSSITEQSCQAGVKKRHVQLSMQFNEEIFKRNVLTDVECVVQGKVFNAHRVLLVCFSPYLKKKLLNSQGKPTYKRVQIPKIGVNEFEILLQYMYTGNMAVDCNTFFDVYKAASLLDMQEAKLECLKLIDGKDEIRTYFYSYVLSKKLGVQQNWQKAFKLITHRFEETVFSKEFLQLDLNYVTEILTSQTIGARSETIVFLAALNWLNFDVGNRGVHAVTAMECVRFSCMSMEEIVACYHPPLLAHIVQIPDVMMMLYRATCYIAAKSQGQENWFKQYACPKRNLTFEYLPMELWHKRSPTAGSQRVKDSSKYDPSDGVEQYDAKPTRLKPPIQVAAGNVGDKNKQYVEERLSGKYCDSAFDVENIDAAELRVEKNLSHLDKLYEDMNLDSESHSDEEDFDSEVEFQRKDEALRDILRNERFEKRRPEAFDKNKKVPEHIDVPYDRPEQPTKIVHLSKGPKKVFKSEREKEVVSSMKESTPVRENVLEDVQKTSKLDKQSSGKKLHENCEDAEHITLSLTKCSHTKENKLRKNDRMVSINVNLSPTEVNKPPEDKLEDNCNAKQPVPMKDETSLKQDDCNTKQPVPVKGDTSVKVVPNNQDMKSDGFILIIGGMNPKDFKKDVGESVLLFNPPKNDIKRYTNIPKPRHNHSAACVNNFLYVIGGCKPQETIEKNRYIAKRSCFRLNLKTLTWSTLSDMKCARYDHGLVVYDNQLFVIGGQDETGRLLKSVEVYDPKRSRWKLLNSNMCCGRKAMGTALYNDRIWIVGGLIESGKRGNLQAVSIVDCYDPKEKKWYFNIYSLPTASCFCSLAIWDKKLFCVGGMIRADQDKTCSTDEVWFVDNENELWKKGPPLPEPRMGGIAVTHGSNLYYLGGFDPDSTVKDQHVFILLPGATTWDVGPALASHIFGLSVVSSSVK